MTISAWINSTAFPRDDAAIVSSHNPRAQGYQLDTTVDRGVRTLGLKLANSCGQLMARYGRTPLAMNTWYYVVGVYDAEAQLLEPVWSSAPAIGEPPSGSTTSSAASGVR